MPVWTLPAFVSPFNLQSAAGPQRKKTIKQFMGWRGITRLSRWKLGWFIHINLYSLSTNYDILHLMMLNRTDSYREFGYKEPVQRKKKYFNSQWFRYLSLCQLAFPLPSFRPSGDFNRLLVQRVGGSWDGYWLTESLINDGDAFSGGIAYWWSGSS